MHELGISQSLVAIVSEQAQGKKVHRVWLEIGEYTALMPDALRFCFDVVTRGTVLEGAKLDIVEISPGMQCEECGTYSSSQHAIGDCEQCGSTRLRKRTGDELNIKAMEVETCA